MAHIIELSKLGDENGQLSVITAQKEIPFSIVRIFYIYGLKMKTVRGNHANRNSRFCMICVAGSCEVEVDDGKVKSKYHLDCPNKALITEKMTWKTMYNFSEDCVLIVLSDCVYDKNEYITDYQTFLKEVCQ